MKLCIKYQRPGPSASDKKIFKNFPYMGLCKKSESWRGAIFDPRAII